MAANADDSKPVLVRESLTTAHLQKTLPTGHIEHAMSNSTQAQPGAAPNPVPTQGGNQSPATASGSAPGNGTPNSD